MPQKQQKIHKLWGGNFSHLPPQHILDFASGSDVKGKKPYDERLIPYDIAVNQAHVKMLSKQQIISAQDARLLLKGLEEIKALYKQGKFTLSEGVEDVHTAIEVYLIKKYGVAVGGKVHTARSRNDQVATDMRLYLKDQTKVFIVELTQLIFALQQLKKKYACVKIPGFTHHRPAMVTTLGVVFGAWKEGVVRDKMRFKQWLTLYDKSPLGAGTGYGTSFPIDRKYTAKLLGFSGAEPNILDPITNRGETETAFVFTCALMMKHFSQIAQTLILWSMPQFGYISLPDGFCTGSSIMPHKKNPDVLEVIKAKAAILYGALQSLLAINSGNFIGYNRDTQWTKYLVMDAVDESFPGIKVLKELFGALSINEHVLVKACKEDDILITCAMEKEVQQTGQSLRAVKQRVEKALKI